MKLAKFDTGLTAQDFGQTVANGVGHLLRLLLRERCGNHDLETGRRLKHFLSTQTCGTADQDALTEGIIDNVLEQPLLQLDRLGW